METKHTPGPWTIPAEKSLHEREINMLKVIGPDRYLGVASAFGDCREETLANARLIAAAPDLLEALLYLADWKARCHSDDIASDDGWKKARAAIAKATGKE